MARSLFCNLYNCLKVNKNINILNYSNKYIDIIFILIHEGILRGFYFEYFFQRKFIILLFKYRSQFIPTIISNKTYIGKKFNLFIWRTNCGILVNLKRKLNNNVIFTIS